MKTADVDILIVPGWSSSGADHWQTRWQNNMKTARRVEQGDWYNPDKAAWTARIVEDVVQSVRPVVLVAHSLGVIAVVHAAEKLGRLPGKPVVGAFLVAPADVENAEGWPVTDGWTFNGGQQTEASSTPAVGGDGRGFAPIPTQPLPFPSVVVGSANDPYCSAERAKFFADRWNAALIESGDVGHINTASGHGPWPDGLLAFGMFLQRLG